jgi:hypothetical protein
MCSAIELCIVPREVVSGRVVNECCDECKAMSVESRLKFEAGDGDANSCTRSCFVKGEFFLRFLLGLVLDFCYVLPDSYVSFWDSCGILRSI